MRLCSSIACLTLASAFLSGGIHAAGFRNILSDQKADLTEEAEGDHAPIIDSLQGILVIGQPQLVQRGGRDDISGVELYALDIPGKQANLQEKLQKFIGHPLTRNNIMLIKQEIVAYYRMYDRPVMHVQIPEQNIKRGVLQILVYETVLGEIRSVGNEHFSSKRLLSYMSLTPGAPIDAEVLTEDLEWMNRNTFRQTDAFFTPGKDSGTTDIVLITKDQQTWRLYAGTDNTGLEQTGEERWFGGINFANFCNWDQQFSYQFTSASNFHDFYAHTFMWTIPLPWRDMLSFYGGYSDVHAHHLNVPNNPGFGTHGQSWQGSMRWDVPLPGWKDFLHEFLAGADFKRTNNNLTFAGTEFFGQNVNLFQLVAGYNCGYEVPWTKVSFTWENFYSPGTWLPNQTHTDYNDLRQYANPHYYYTRMSLSPTFRHVQSGMVLSIVMRGQWSTANLLSSEEYGIGGYNTVRGYDERQFNGDWAFNGNAEIRSPEWKLFFRGKYRDAFQLLVFYDYGKIWVKRQLIGEPRFEMIDSVGAGCRYFIDRWLTARVDWGWKLVPIPELEHKRYKFHFSVIASY